MIHSVVEKNFDFGKVLQKMEEMGETLGRLLFNPLHRLLERGGIEIVGQLQGYRCPFFSCWLLWVINIAPNRNAYKPNWPR